MPCAGWLTALCDAAPLCQRAAVAAYRAAAGELSAEQGVAEVSIVLADDDMVQNLNHKFRDQDKPTNVLSFPLGDDGIAPGNGGRLLGDVILAFETTQREAAEQAKSLVAHTSHLVVHGVLHVLGFDHEDRHDAEDMEALEREILATLNIADPYLSEQAAATMTARQSPR